MDLIAIENQMEGMIEVVCIISICIIRCYTNAIILYSKSTLENTIFQYMVCPTESFLRLGCRRRPFTRAPST